MERTKWYGLWRNRAGVYSGQVINKSDMPKRARLIIRKNKFYEADSNKPQYVYCFADAEAWADTCIEMEKVERKPWQFGYMVEGLNWIDYAFCPYCEQMFNPEIVSEYDYCPHCGGKIDNG